MPSHPVGNIRLGVIAHDIARALQDYLWNAVHLRRLFHRIVVGFLYLLSLAVLRVGCLCIERLREPLRVLVSLACHEQQAQAYDHPIAFLHIECEYTTFP